MALIVSRSILILLLFAVFVNVAQAERLWRPPEKYLPAEKLETLLEEWNKARIGGTLRDMSNMVWRVTARHPSGSYHLAYRNPEIIDRVVDYYLLVAEGSFPSNDDNSLSGEGQAESILNLAAVAETTYDPRLHEAVLFNVGFLTGDFRYHYLATVNPERTLEVLLESKRGDKAPWANEGRGGNSEYFYHRDAPPGTSLLLNFPSAFTILAYMVMESSYALRDERERVLAFIGEHALRFAKSYLPGHDYYVRYDALDVMELIGTDTDVPLVEKLIEDGRQFDLYRLQYKSAGFGRRLKKFEQIQDKGLRIIEILRRRSPSQR